MSRNLDKNPFIGKKDRISQGLLVKKKPILAIAFTSALLLSTVAGTQFVNLGRANPYIRDWVKEGDVSPPNGTLPPTILILSPENDTAYASNKVSLTLNVSMPESNKVSLSITEIYYKASWQSSSTYVDLKTLRIANNYTLPPNFSINMTDMPEGPRWLEVYAVATGFAYESRHELEGIFYTTYYVGYKISSSSVVNFTIDTTPPVISVLTMENKTYDTLDVPLSFAVNEPVSQTSYSLDAKDNVTVAGNTILTGLSEGAHSITVYATDNVGNTGASETIYFSVEEPTYFPTTMIMAPVASVAFAGAGLMVYLKKRKR